MNVEQLNHRAFYRHDGQATAEVVRDSDPLRQSIAGKLQSVSCSGVAVLLPVPLAVDEYIHLELENPVQRCIVRCRATVRSIQALDDGWHRAACSLLNRLTEREIIGLTPIQP